MEEVKEIEKIYAEEYLDIDESLVELEKDRDIIRMEMNIVELPIFSKNSKRKKNQQMTYWFKHDKTSYVEVEPPAGYSIPGEFEERVFIALTKIMRNNNYNRSFYVTANEILEGLGVTNKAYYTKLKTAMYTLAQTNYRFKNSLYSAELEGIIDDLILTHIMDVRIITRTSKEEEAQEKFEDKRVKEIYKITFTEDFYKNIVTKGYLAFDSELLLKIENSIARTIYTLTEKLRKYDLYLKRPVYFIARRIPLKWDSRQLKRTMNVIEKALDELKDLDLIKDYNIIKLKKWDLAELEIFYDEKHNKMKKDNFFAEKNEFKSIELLIHSTEEKQVENEHFDIKNIIELLPERAKVMKTIEKFIEDAINKYGYEYVFYTCEYVVMKNPVSFKAYLTKALKENYADEYIAKKKIKEQKKVIEEPKEVIEEANIVKYSYEDFENYSEELKNEVLKKVYENFLMQAEANDNKIMRDIFEKSKKGLIVDYINKNEMVESNEKIDEIIIKDVPVTKFLLEVANLMKEKEIDFDLENVATIFKIFGEFEDKNIKIEYNSETKIGKIKIL